MKGMKVALGASVLNLAALFWIIQKLPDMVPVHLNVNMAVDRYGSRWIIFIIGLIPVLFAAMRIWIIKVPAQNQKIYDIAMPFLAAFLIAITWLPVLIAFQYGNPANEQMKLPIDFIIAFPIGVMLIIFSNFLGVIKRNPWMGIRLHWTLTDETVWKKTNRLGGFLGVISGFIICSFSVAGLLLENPRVTIAGIIIGVILFVGVSTVYSFCLYRKLHS